MSIIYSKPMRMSIVVAVLMACSGVAAVAITPRTLMAQSTSMEKTVPDRFGDWTQLPTGMLQMALSVTADGQRSEEQPYDEVVMRSYVNSYGEVVMLALAYAREQRQEVKIHRPEVCYMAQGYKPLQEDYADFPLAGHPHGIPGQRLLMNGNNRTEAVSYWIRVGEEYPRGGLGTRLAIFLDGMKGRVPDAILVRVSSIIAKPEEAPGAFKRQEAFLSQLVQAMRPEDAAMLVAANH